MMDVANELVHAGYKGHMTEPAVAITTCVGPIRRLFLYLHCSFVYFRLSVLKERIGAHEAIDITIKLLLLI